MEGEGITLRMKLPFHPHFLAGLFLATERIGMEHTLLESLQELDVKIYADSKHSRENGLIIIIIYS